jgi:hypothetical protein
MFYYMIYNCSSNFVKRQSSFVNTNFRAYLDDHYGEQRSYSFVAFLIVTLVWTEIHQEEFMAFC